MNKKGEITTDKLVKIILTIVISFVIFGFIFLANFNKIEDETICYNSVVQRSNIFKLSKDLVAPSLDCRTNYVCITKDGSCESMTSPEIVEVKNSDDVYREIAERMVSCWDMFGSGKLNYVGKTFDKNLYCSNCYLISFDDSLDFFPNREMDKRELFRYLSSQEIPETETSYLEYLVGLESSQKIESGLNSVGIDFEKINLDKQHYLTMGAYSDVSIFKTILLHGGVAVGTFAVLSLAVVSGGSAVPVGLLIFGAGSSVGVGVASGFFVGTIIQGDSGQQFLTPTLVEANSEKYDKLDCTSILTLA
jgi:hypothetical protein